MIDPFDYKEPACATCGGKEFYSPDKDAPAGRIPIRRVIEKADEAYNKNDMAEAGRLLEYWQKEAEALGDESGELSVTDELIGYYRKTGNAEKGLAAVARALELLSKLDLKNTVSGATILLNAATTMKAFGKAEEGLPLYDEAEKVYLANLKENDVLFAGLYNNKALALTDAGKYEEAESCYKKAIDVMTSQDSAGNLDAAVSFVNLAVLLRTRAENGGNNDGNSGGNNDGSDKEKITDCLFKAYGLLTDEKNQKNGYYAFVLSKCAPAFGAFGYTRIENELKKESEEIYERNRNQRNIF